jgi:peptidoglycan/LPS O-acetylase OafA/YrhL
MPRHQAAEQPFASYAISRLFRIAPLFYVLLGYEVLRTWYLGGWTSPSLIVENALFLYNLDPSNAWGIVGAGWTIGAEMLFYVLFPFFYRRIKATSGRLSATC